MPLKLTLKPNEKVLIGTAVIANGPAKIVAHVVADGAPAKVCEIPMDLLQPRDWLSRHPEWSRPVPLRDASAVTVDDHRPGETPSLTVSE